MELHIATAAEDHPALRAHQLTKDGALLRRECGKTHVLLQWHERFAVRRAHLLANVPHITRGEEEFTAREEAGDPDEEPLYCPLVGVHKEGGNRTEELIRLLVPHRDASARGEAPVHLVQ